MSKKIGLAFYYLGIAAATIWSAVSMSSYTYVDIKNTPQ